MQPISGVCGRRRSLGWYGWRRVPGKVRSGAFPAIFIPINLMVRGGGEIHCGPGTPGSEPWPGTRHPYQPKLRCGRSRLADLQAELAYNQRLIADFGMQKNVGDWQQGTLRLPERRWRHFAGWPRPAAPLFFP